MIKNVFIEISDPNLTFFSDLWRILRPLGLFSYAYYCLTYNFRSFPQSLDDAKHVRIQSIGIKNFCWKKSFHRNFWPKFDFSNGVNMRKSHHLPPLCVKKNFWDVLSKIRFHSFVGLDLENRLSTHNMAISLELKAKKVFGEKIKKPPLSALLK